VERRHQGRRLHGEPGPATNPNLTLSIAAQDWLDMLLEQAVGADAVHVGTLKVKETWAWR